MKMRVLLGAITASLLAAVVVTVVSLGQTPTYEASAKVVVEDQKEQSYGRIHLIPPPPRKTGSWRSSRR